MIHAITAPSSEKIDWEKETFAGLATRFNSVFFHKRSVTLTKRGLNVKFVRRGRPNRLKGLAQPWQEGLRITSIDELNPKQCGAPVKQGTGALSSCYADVC